MLELRGLTFVDFTIILKSELVRKGLVEDTQGL